jgi:hypothetical protein
MTKGDFRWLFVSHMGASLPAYYFYSLGATFVGGLLVPCAAIFFFHNRNLISALKQQNGSSTSSLISKEALEHLNWSSFATAFLGTDDLYLLLIFEGAVFLALQGTFPMRDETLLIHCVLATSFFGSLVFHSIITAYLHWMMWCQCCADSHVHCICAEHTGTLPVQSGYP